MNNFIKRIYIKKQDNLYKFKNDLIDFGLVWLSKENYYYNKYELNDNIFNDIIWLCKKNELKIEMKNEEHKSEVAKIESIYSLNTLNDSTFIIKNRKDNKSIYIISIFNENAIDTINFLDNEKSKLFTIKTKLKDSKNKILSIFNIIEKREVELKEEKKDFNFDRFFLIMSILMSEFTLADEIYGKINKFKFYNISKIPQNTLLCNCVKGFYPETIFYLEKGKIRSSFTQNYLNKEQEYKIWKFLFYNRDRVAKDHKPTLWDLFVDGKLNVSINGYETKMPISNVIWNGGNIKVQVFNGIKKVTLNKTFNKDELWAQILENR